MIGPEPVDEPVPLTDELIVDVIESLPLLLLLTDGNAPLVTDEVGDGDNDVERLNVVVGVDEEVEVPDDVALPVGDIEAVTLALIVDDGVIGGVTVAVNDTEGVTLAVPP